MILKRGGLNAHSQERSESKMLKTVRRTLSWSLLLALLWVAGNFAFFPNYLFAASPMAHQVHLVIVLILAVGILHRAIDVRGSTEDRIKEIVIWITISFGVYALVILVGRYFFSRTIFATVVPATLFFSLLIIWIRNRREGVRTAIIAPLVKGKPSRIPGADLLTDPAADFRPYDLILVDLHAPVSAEWASALSRAMLCGCRIRHIEDHIEERSGAVSIQYFELEHLPSTDYDSYIAVKRLTDIAGCIILAPIAIPVVVLASIAIVLSSGWPVFFVQPRTGLGGEPFRMWKLRTMRPANEHDHRAAIPGDQRITPIGRFMRRTRIDELPQLWNVLKGDMSLIGPRPEVVSFHESYVAIEPKFAYRCLVRPGITGWAQVNAPPSATVDEAIFKARYDLYYVKKQSLALDLLIAIRTIWTVTHGGGVR